MAIRQAPIASHDASKTSGAHRRASRTARWILVRTGHVCPCRHPLVSRRTMVARQPSITASMRTPTPGISDSSLSLGTFPPFSDDVRRRLRRDCNSHTGGSRRPNTAAVRTVRSRHRPARGLRQVEVHPPQAFCGYAESCSPLDVTRVARESMPHTRDSVNKRASSLPRTSCNDSLRSRHFRSRQFLSLRIPS